MHNIYIYIFPLNSTLPRVNLKKYKTGTSSTPSPYKTGNEFKPEMSPSGLKTNSKTFKFSLIFGPFNRQQ